jgi:hypothetical protein
MTHPSWSVRELLALAYLERLREGQQPLPRRVRLDDTGRAPVVPLTPTGADRG